MVLRALRTLLLLSLAAVPALAQQTLTALPAFSLERLDLDPDALGALAVGSGRTLSSGDFRAAAAFELERNPLVLVRPGSADQDVIHDRYTAHLSFAIGVTDRLELSAHLPFVPYQHGDTVSVAGFEDPSSAALLQPTIAARFGLLRSAHGAPLDLALHLGVQPSIGSKHSFGAGDDTYFIPQLLISKQLGPVLASLDLGALLRKQASLGADTEGSELQAEGALAIGETVRGELMARFGHSLIDSDNSVEFFAALRVHPIRALELFAMGGPGVGDTPGTPRFRAMLGLAFTPGFGAAPQPAQASAIARPAQLAVSRGPEVEPAPVIAEKPKGPCDPGGKHEPAQCPLLDDDGDGIANGIDVCPLEKGPIETRGCPVKDTDGDGVPDYLDNCPKEPGPASNQGCPVKLKQLVVITKTRLEIKDKVYFASGKAILLPRSYPLLNQVAQVIRQHPELPLISIDGHTDSTGSAAQNKTLSQARAETVLRYLGKQGVAADRLSARGFGSERQIDTNETAAGRANNRRVEFNLARAEAAPATPNGSAQPGSAPTSIQTPVGPSEPASHPAPPSSASPDSATPAAPSAPAANPEVKP